MSTEQQKYDADARASERESFEYVVGGKSYHPRRMTIKVSRNLQKYGRRAGRISQLMALNGREAGELMRKLSGINDEGQFDSTMERPQGDEKMTLLKRLDQIEDEQEELQDQLDDILLDEICVALREPVGGELKEPDKGSLGENLDYQDMLAIVNRVNGIDVDTPAEEATTAFSERAAKAAAGVEGSTEAQAAADSPPVPAAAGAPAAGESEPETAPESSTPRPKRSPPSQNGEEVKGPLEAVPAETTTVT